MMAAKECVHRADNCGIFVAFGKRVGDVDDYIVGLATASLNGVGRGQPALRIRRLRFNRKIHGLQVSSHDGGAQQTWFEIACLDPSVAIEPPRLAPRVSDKHEAVPAAPTMADSDQSMDSQGLQRLGRGDDTIAVRSEEGRRDAHREEHGLVCVDSRDDRLDGGGQSSAVSAEPGLAFGGTQGVGSPKSSAI